MLKDKVVQLVNQFLVERPDLFMIDLKLSDANDITLILDGDEGVSLQDCLDASRAIEFSLDREEEDFSLQVMSAGAAEPLQNIRQYRKNIGRDLHVVKPDGAEEEGELVRVEEENFMLLKRYRKPKDIGKGKVDVEEEVVIPYSDVAKAQVKIKF